MILIVLLVLILLLVCWLLFSAFELRIDTRIALASFRWISIGKIFLVYENDTWWLRLQLFFFKKEWTLQQLFSGKRKKLPQPAAGKKKKSKTIPWRKFFTLLKTFRVVQWKVVADTGNYPLNAQLYPLNFYPPFQKHVVVNFNDENYVVLVIRNSPWRLLYAWIK